MIITNIEEVPGKRIVEHYGLGKGKGDGGKKVTNSLGQAVRRG
jgi:uncharacterized protein YbjQ (UPF0145 family)